MCSPSERAAMPGPVPWGRATACELQRARLHPSHPLRALGLCALGAHARALQEQVCAETAICDGRLIPGAERVDRAERAVCVQAEGELGQRLLFHRVQIFVNFYLPQWPKVYGI